MNCKMCFIYCIFYKKCKLEKVNYILITLFIIIFTSCGQSPKIDSSFRSNEQKDKIITDSTFLSIKNSNNNDPPESGSLTETFDLPFDTLNKKATVANDESIISNMPAATYSGRYVIVKTSPYSCCYFDGYVLQLYDMSCNKIVQQIQIAPSEDDKWTDATFDSLRIQVGDMINAGNYYTMTAIHKDSSKIIKQNSEIDSSIELIINNKIYKSKTFKLDSIEYGDSWCCLGLIENDYECKIPPSIINIWMDARERLILLEYGIMHAADGCERGPFFKTIDLFENK